MPIVYEQTAAPGIALWHIQEPPEVLQRGLELSMPAAGELARIRHASRRQQWLAARQALAHLQPDVLPMLTREACGRPFVEASPRHVSLSHTKGGAAAALSDRPIAIDIEDLRRERHPNLPRMFMNADELAWYQAAPSLRKLLLIWTAKECLYKLHSRHHSEISFRRELAVDLAGLNAESTELSGRFARGSECNEHRFRAFAHGDWLVCHNL